MQTSIKIVFAGLLLVAVVAPQGAAAMEQKNRKRALAMKTAIGLNSEVSKNIKLYKSLVEKMRQQSLVLAFRKYGWFGLGLAYLAKDEVVLQPYKAPFAVGKKVANENELNLASEVAIGLKNALSEIIILNATEALIPLLTARFEEQSRSLLLDFQFDIWFVRRAKRMLKGEDEDVAAAQDLQKVFDKTMTLDEFIAQYFKHN